MRQRELHVWTKETRPKSWKRLKKNGLVLTVVDPADESEGVVVVHVALDAVDQMGRGTAWVEEQHWPFDSGEWCVCPVGVPVMAPWHIVDVRQVFTQKGRQVWTHTYSYASTKHAPRAHPHSDRHAHMLHHTTPDRAPSRCIHNSRDRAVERGRIRIRP